MKKRYFLAFLLIIPFLLFFYDKPVKQDSKLSIAVSFFPLYDITRNIAGDKAEVISLIPPGASPHTFEINPSVMKKSRNVKVIFTLGEIDSWADDIIKNIPGAEIYQVSDRLKLQPLVFEEGEESFDPHYWLSIYNAKIIAENIAYKLSVLDEKNKEFFLKNMEEYKKKLDQTYKDISSLLAPLSKREILVFHESWNYFAQEFNLKVVGVFSLSPGKEIPPRHLKKLYDTVKKYNIKVIFSEPQTSPEALKSFVRDLNLKVYTLDTMEGGGDTYINTLLNNSRIIKQALNE